MKIIELENIVKEFRDHFWTKKKRILNGISLSVNDGAIHGFLGPNGAGKTTAIKILMGLLFPTQGKARVLGCDISEVSFKREVGYLPENPYFYDYLNPKEFLRFYGELFKLDKRTIEKRLDDLLHEVGLAEYGDLQLRKFSKGMLQRIGLAQALINDPKLLILDEPMTGLDPIGRKTIRDVILRCKGAGKTIFFSSHILSDVEMICEEVSIIVHGKIMDSGYLRDLLNPKTYYYEVQIDQDKEAVLKEDYFTGRETQKRGKSIFIKVTSDVELKETTSFLLDKGVHILSVIPVKETLEDLFTRRVVEKR